MSKLIIGVVIWFLSFKKPDVPVPTECNKISGRTCSWELTSDWSLVLNLSQLPSQVIVTYVWGYKQHPMKQQLYSHLSPISKTIQVRWTRHADHCWRSKDELISDALLWTPSHGCSSVGWPARTYLHQLCVDTGFSLKDLPRAMDDRDGWRERVREIHAINVMINYIYIYINKNNLNRESKIFY